MISEIDGGRWTERLVACAIAERALAIIDVAATKRTVAEVQGLVDSLWDLALSSDRSAALEFAAQAERLPEFGIDDDRRATYFAGSALEAISAAANAVGGGPQMDRRAVDVMLEAFSELDGIATYPQIQFIDPRNPPPPGDLESEEARRIDRDRRALAGVAEATDAAARLRDRAAADRVAIEAVVSQRLAESLAKIGSER